MKMSDVFELPLDVDNDPFSEHAPFAVFSGERVVMAGWYREQIESAVHAINMHDELLNALETIYDERNSTDGCQIRWDSVANLLAKARGEVCGDIS